MQTYISILRAINVSGHKKMKMADLRQLYEKLDFKEVVSYIQSGNIIFKSKKEKDKDISAKIEQAIFEQYQFQVPVIIRTAGELKQVIADNPYLKEKNIDESKLHVSFLEEAPAPVQLANLDRAVYAPDSFIIRGKEVYLHCPVSYGNTKLTNSFFENKLKIKATTRNWKTINKLAEMASEN